MTENDKKAIINNYLRDDQIYICNSCLKESSKDYFYKHLCRDYYYSKCQHCGEESFALDKDIAEVYYILKNKNYNIIFSCSGHLSKGLPYLSFDQDELFSNLPKDLFQMNSKNKLGEVKVGVYINHFKLLKHYKKLNGNRLFKSLIPSYFRLKILDYLNGLYYNKINKSNLGKYRNLLKDWAESL